MPATAAARQWFRFENKADNPAVAEIHIIDYIGGWIEDWLERNYGYDEGVTARKFVEQLAALPESVNAIHVHINSPGGDVQGGVNIANALREQASKGRTVETFVDGIAASIASVIAMAGSKVHMADNALMMIHCPWSWAIGNAAEMRKQADVLDTVEGQIINTYKWHTDLSDEELSALLLAETWMNADEAIAKGFATDKIEGLKAAASINPKALGALKVPDQYKDRVAGFIAKPEQPAPAPQPAAAADILRLCTEAQLDLQFANALISAKVADADLPARIAAEKDARAKAQQRAEGITAACKLANVPDLADGYIKGSMSLDAVKAHLVTIKAHLDKVEIDGHLDPNEGAPNHSAGWKKAFTLARGSRH